MSPMITCNFSLSPQANSTGGGWAFGPLGARAKDDGCRGEAINVMEVTHDATTELEEKNEAMVEPLADGACIPLEALQ